MKGQGFARQVTLETLDKFGSLLRKKQSAEDDGDGLDEGNNRNGASDDPLLREAEALFHGESIRAHVPFTRKRKPGELRAKKKKAGAKKNAAKVSTPAAKRPAPKKGPILWRKKLKASDCQRQPGHGTGGVRLTQARFKVKGKVIDQTSYFRDLFSGFPWVEARQTPFVERAEIPFHIMIHGHDHGVHALLINHKPSGEAGQNNQTTDLKWTGMTKTIQDLNLTGSELVLYGPAPGTTQPFFIEIT
jgi:hypothetical protein